MKRKVGLTLSQILWLEKVYKSCKNDEQRQTYFAWEERLFKLHTLPAAKLDPNFAGK